MGSAAFKLRAPARSSTAETELTVVFIVFLLFLVVFRYLFQTTSLQRTNPPAQDIAFYFFFEPCRRASNTRNEPLTPALSPSDGEREKAERLRVPEIAAR